MTTKAQQLKKELTQAFPELKFSVKTEKRRQSWSDTPIIYLIRLTVTGLIGSPYTKRQVEKIANKYRNDVTATYVTIKNIDGDSLYEEIMRMVPDYENNWETVHKIADNDCSTVLPDGYYEEKIALQNPQSQEVIDSAVTEIIEEETIDTNDKWFDECFSDLTVGELTKEIESRMELIINNSFGNIFHSEISVNCLGNLLVATIDGVEYHVPLLLDALCNYTDEDFDNGGYYDLSDYLRDCKYTPEAASETHKEATVVASNSPFMTTWHRFLEKVETQIKGINNLCFPKSHRIKDIQVSCSQVNGQLVVSVDNRIYCAKSLLVAINNFDVNADSEDYLNIWDYLKSCKFSR